MEKSLLNTDYRWNSIKPFFPALFNPPEGWIFCSPEQSKLCFEQREMQGAAQNKLVRHRRKLKTPSEVGVFQHFKMMFYGRK